MNAILKLDHARRTPVALDDDSQSRERRPRKREKTVVVRGQLVKVKSSLAGLQRAGHGPRV